MASQYFNNRYYQPSAADQMDMSVGDFMANRADYVVSFYHVPTKREIYFKAYVTAFNETYNSDWTAESVYGRADPIYQFKQTSRTMALALKVPAETASEAYENLGKVGLLTQFLYPVYGDMGNAGTIKQSPLIRMKVMNLARKTPNSDVDQTTRTASDLYNEYSSHVDASQGLLGVVANLTINHNIEGDDGVIFKGENTILPKLIDINLTFNPIHENPLGWEGEGDTWNFGGSDGTNANFPYGVALQTKTEDSQTGWSDSTGQVYLTDGARQAAEDEKDAATYEAGALERMAERAAELEQETIAAGDYGQGDARITFE